MANYMNKYSTKQAYDADGEKQYPNISYISGTDKLEYKPFEPIYRWHGTYAETGDYICDYETNEKKDKAIKQVSYDNGQTWENVVPAEYSATTVIEYDSTDCGYDDGGDDDGCWKSADELKELFYDGAFEDEYLQITELKYNIIYDGECINGEINQPNATLYLYEDDGEGGYSRYGKINPKCCCHDGCDCNDEEDPESMGCEDNGEGEWVGCPDNGCRSVSYDIYSNGEGSWDLEEIYPDIDCTDESFNPAETALGDHEMYIKLDEIPDGFEPNSGWQFKLFDGGWCD